MSCPSSQLTLSPQVRVTNPDPKPNPKPNPNPNSNFVSSGLVPVSSDLLWIEEFLAYSLATCIGTLLLLSISVYYDVVFANEMERFGKDIKKKRDERVKFIFEKVENSFAISKIFRFHFMLFMIPGGLIYEDFEDFGFHHWGDLIVYFSGYVVPVMYGIVLILLGGRLAGQDTESFEEGEHLGSFLIWIGSITIIAATFSQLCEVSSRLAKYNPKVIVTAQDTFRQRESMVQISDAEYQEDY